MSRRSDSARSYKQVGNGNRDTGLRDAIQQKREEVRENKIQPDGSQVPIVDSERRVMEEDKWLSKARDRMNSKFSALPPIEANKVVTKSGMAFVQD